MHYTSVLALVAMGLSSIHAAPYYSNGTDDTLTTSTPPDTPTKEYYLVTQVTEPGKEDKDGLYVSGYHTGEHSHPRYLPNFTRSGRVANSPSGAGTNDVTLGSINVASKGFLNDTYQQFDYGTEFPWGFQMGGDSNYAGIYTQHERDPHGPNR